MNKTTTSSIGARRAFNSALLPILTRTRDLLCAFHRDRPEAYQPHVNHALTEGLAWVERAKIVNAEHSQTEVLDLLCEWLEGGECFCLDPAERLGRGPCAFCKTQELLGRSDAEPFKAAPEIEGEGESDSTQLTAPELLSALEALLAFNARNPCCNFELMPTIVQARAAIAKAKGESK